MTTPAKIDVTTPCPQCGGIMNIVTVRPVPGGAFMEHDFTCASCAHAETFQYPKKAL